MIPPISVAAAKTFCARLGLWEVLGLARKKARCGPQIEFVSKMEAFTKMGILLSDAQLCFLADLASGRYLGPNPNQSRTRSGTLWHTVHVHSGRKKGLLL